MNFLYEIITNYVLVCAFAGWFVAQFLKFFTGVFRIKKFSVVELLFGTGGMPSSHTSAVYALATGSIIKHGFNSTEFAISVVLAMVVMRDAMGMRRQVGEHAKALNLIIKDLSEANNDPELTNKALAELIGHTPLQVFAGALVGIVVAVGFMFIPVFGVGPNAVAPAAVEAVNGSVSQIGNIVNNYIA